MNIFDQYGIKEVADVTLYSIHKKKDGSGDVYYVPALYLDTLKISSTEKTAENVWAEGGLGNARLINWDYGKTLNVSLEDALCTPASLGMCWGGVLGSDWEDAKIRHDFGISYNDKNPVERLSRMEKAFYPRNDRDRNFIGYLLPQTEEERKNTYKTRMITNSQIVDGTVVEGFGWISNRSYKWNMAIESDMKSIAIVPEKFFDTTGRSYKINQKRTIGVVVPNHSILQNDIKYEIIYSINADEPSDTDITANIFEITELSGIVEETTIQSGIDAIANAKYLKIRVSNDNRYSALIGDSPTGSFSPNSYVNVEQFKGIDMWNKFDSINEMIYFILTKYEDNIIDIYPAHIEGGEETGVIYSVSPQAGFVKGFNLWSYVNPRTMEPYPDDYWFRQGEPYYIKSLTIAPNDKKLKAQKITITAGQFPGMYMLVGETYIRSRDTGEDERMQIKIPMCKVRSDQNLTLEAAGDPTTFNMELEVAKPESGIMMEITAYEIAKKIEIGEDGVKREMDGSTVVLSE